MDLRTKPINESITMDDSTESGKIRYIEYQPGNGTRYRLLISSIQGFGERVSRSLGLAPNGGWVVTFVGNKSTSVVISPGSFLAPWYLQEKIAPMYSESDCVVLAELLGHLLGIEYVSCREYLKDRAERGVLPAD